MGLFPNYAFEISNVLLVYSPGIYKKTITYSILVVSFVVIGILISEPDKIKNKTIKSFENNLSECREIGKIILIFTFPLEVVLDLYRIYLAMTQGYLSTYSMVNIKGYGIILCIANFYLIGVCLLIVGNLNKKINSICIAIFFIAYAMLTMLSGGRSQGILAIIIILFILGNYVIKIKKSYVLITFIAAYLLFAVMNAITSIRMGSVISIQNIFSEFMHQLKYNKVILRVLEEFGNSIYTPSITVSKMGNELPYAFGSTYIKALISILPILGSDMQRILTEASYSNALNINSIGGSYIGELYYNFGFYSFPLAVFIGIFVNKVCYNFRKITISKNYVMLAYMIPVLSGLIWWARDYFTSFVRTTIWAGILIYLLKLNYRSQHRTITKIRNELL
jgi:oligosaccharide repeat unit polymerase